MGATRGEIREGVGARQADACEALTGAHSARAVVERLFARLLPGLVEWAHGRLPRHARRRSDTLDLVQDACTGAITHLQDLDSRDPAQVDFYLRRSIRNRILDEVRRAGRGEVVSSEGLAVEDPRPTPHEEAVESDERRRYRRALLRLQDDDQQLVVGRVELKLSYEELARATGRESAEATRCAVRRAMLRLAYEIGALERRATASATGPR